MTIAYVHRLSRQKRISRRRGMALLVVVVLIMLTALGAYRFSFFMESQYRLTRLHEEQVHARLAAISGMELAATIVEMSPTQRMSIGGLVVNPAVFRDIAVDFNANSTANQRDPNLWRFCLLSPRSAEQATNSPQATAQIADAVSLPIRFGLENESAKLHMPTLIAWDQMMPGHARNTLLGLPGASEKMVDAWLQEIGVSGRADKGGFQGQLASLDDLRHTWFGGDLNQNYQLDPLEIRLANQHISKEHAASPASIGSVNGVGGYKPLQRFVTWVSGHRNVTRNGHARIFLNEPDLQSLHRQLSLVWPTDWADFVIAMRQFGPSNSAAVASASTELVSQWSPDFGKAAIFAFRSPLDLVGAVVDLPSVSASNSSSSSTGQSSQVKRTLRNPFSSELSEVRNYLGRVLDDVTVEISPISEGRIDVSEAPVEVLAGVPGLDLSLAQRMIQQRSGSTNTMTTTQELDTIAWLLDVVDLAKLKELEPYITCRSDVYSVQAVGYRDSQSAVYRITATIDARESPAQLRNQKVWHPWDRGFSIEQLADSIP